MLDQIVRGPLLIPNENGTVTFHPDGALAADKNGILQFAGAFAQLLPNLPENFNVTRGSGPWSDSSNHPSRAGAPCHDDNLRRVGVPAHQSDPPNNPKVGEYTHPTSFANPRIRNSHGTMLPPLLDIHIHIPQHPIRGKFVEGIPDNAPEGKLLAGLNKNVFPTEAKCRQAEHAEKTVRQFLADTLSHGVVGGAAYMTPSALATEIALQILPDTWSVGLVLMNQNCPENMRTDEPNLEANIKRLADKYERRLIVTDRFAVAVNSDLRRRASYLAEENGLRTQTHLNEQVTEKAFVETQLYPHAKSYTDVYLKDGLLDHFCIAAHCIQMTDDEWHILRDTGSVIAHCPTSNLLLNSGTMNLDQVLDRKIPYAIATDVGASPTVSMLAEMARFMSVHRDRSTNATAVEALYRSTRAPSDLLGLSPRLGRLEVGYPMSFIEVEAKFPSNSAENAVLSLLPTDLAQPAMTVNRVTLAGKTVFEKHA